MVSAVPALTASLVAVVIVNPLSQAKLTRHEAKVRTFAALLKETELPADSADATHASITVGGCKRISSGTWVCKGSLYPVAFSGIDGSTCSYTVMVTRSRTRLTPVDC